MSKAVLIAAFIIILSQRLLQERLCGINDHPFANQLSDCLNVWCHESVTLQKKREVRNIITSSETLRFVANVLVLKNTTKDCLCY